MREGVAVVATLGPSAFASEKKSPGTRGKQAALLRAELVAAQEYRAKRSSGDPATVPGRNLRLEALVRVLDKEIPLIITAHRSQDILTALRLAGEFGFTLWLDGAAEAYRHIEEIRAAGIPVLVHPPMARTTGELSNGTFRLAAILREAGIPFAFQSGFEGYVPKTRVVTFEAAQAVAHGLSTEDALAALTINAARLLGIVDRVGSIEVGKDADLALFDGDPFEWTTHCLGAVVDGVSYPGEERPR
jgi:imidazolonepropionase-like amidohydrolase